MKKNGLLIYKTIDLISIIILYHIIGNKSIFLYVLSLSLYNIFFACFDNITIKDYFKNIKTTKSKQKIFKYLLLIITILSFIFLLLSILVSDILSISLKINNTLPIFIIMGISIITRPLIKLLSEYLENSTNNSNYSLLPIIYDIVDKVILIIIAFLMFRVFKYNDISNLSLLYLSKLLGAVSIVYLLYFTRNSRTSYNYVPLEDNINYRKEVKYILKKNSHKSFINVIKNSYYYISIIILYWVLNTRYHYKLNEIENVLTFTYFYALGLINYLVYFSKLVIDRLPKDTKPIDKLYQSFKMILRITIILGIISPLLCKIIFLDTSNSLYFTMVNYLAISILLYEIIYEEIKNKSLIYISLISGLIIKIITIIPLINAFYRMGYNLVYGDILSTMISMFISVIINYIYLRNQSKKSEKYFEKILNILYDNIILAIILIIIQFIIPMNTDNYLWTLIQIFIYLIVSILYIIIKNKKRG